MKTKFFVSLCLRVETRIYSGTISSNVQTGTAPSTKVSNDNKTRKPAYRAAGSVLAGARYGCAGDHGADAGAIWSFVPPIDGRPAQRGSFRDRSADGWRRPGRRCPCAAGSSPSIHHGAGSSCICCGRVRPLALEHLLSLLRQLGGVPHRRGLSGSRIPRVCGAPSGAGASLGLSASSFRRHHGGHRSFARRGQVASSVCRSLQAVLSTQFDYRCRRRGACLRSLGHLDAARSAVAASGERSFRRRIIVSGPAGGIDGARARGRGRREQTPHRLHGPVPGRCES